MNASSWAWFRQCATGTHTCGGVPSSYTRVSLKFLLDQRLSTIPQHQWASKLHGFDFRVEYKPEAANTVADGLSC
jgi:hypothetical protein